MKTNFPNLLAATIRQYRKKSGLTQLQLAELAGVGKTTVFDLEHSKTTVQLNTVLSVLKVLNINLIVQGVLERNE